MTCVPSAAQVADSLKRVDASILLTSIKTGRCCKHDEAGLLKAGAEKKIWQLWLKQGHHHRHSQHWARGPGGLDLIMTRLR